MKRIVVSRRTYFISLIILLFIAIGFGGYSLINPHLHALSVLDSLKITPSTFSPTVNTPVTVAIDPQYSGTSIYTFSDTLQFSTSDPKATIVINNTGYTGPAVTMPTSYNPKGQYPAQPPYIFTLTFGTLSANTTFTVTDEANSSFHSTIIFNVSPQVNNSSVTLGTTTSEIQPTGSDVALNWSVNNISPVSSLTIYGSILAPNGISEDPNLYGTTFHNVSTPQNYSIKACGMVTGIGETCATSNSVFIGLTTGQNNTTLTITPSSGRKPLDGTNNVGLTWSTGLGGTIVSATVYGDVLAPQGIAINLTTNPNSVSYGNVAINQNYYIKLCNASGICAYSNYLNIIPTSTGGSACANDPAPRDVLGVAQAAQTSANGTASSELNTQLAQIATKYQSALTAQSQVSAVPNDVTTELLSFWAKTFLKQSDAQTFLDNLPRNKAWFDTIVPIIQPIVSNNSDYLISKVNYDTIYSAYNTIMSSPLRKISFHHGTDAQYNLSYSQSGPVSLSNQINIFSGTYQPTLSISGQYNIFSTNSGISLDSSYSCSATGTAGVGKSSGAISGEGSYNASLQLNVPFHYQNGTIGYAQLSQTYGNNAAGTQLTVNIKNKW